MGEPLLFLVVAGAGVAVGLARGGTVRGLRDPGVKAARLGLACLAVQCLVVVLPLRAVGLPLALGPVLLLAALATLVGVARPNARLPGVPLFALGLLLNLLVVLVNFGMPVPAGTLQRAGITVEQPRSSAIMFACVICSPLRMPREVPIGWPNWRTNSPAGMSRVAKR